jgi:glycosyltransferase involved in cell wall biosynthesis
MRIGLLVLMAGREAGGPDTYEVQLIRALARLDERNDYFVYCTGNEALRAIDVRQDNFHFRLLRPGIRALSVAVTLPALLKKDGVQLLHSTFTPPPYAPTLQVLTMHCVSSFVHPEFYSRSIGWRLNTLLTVGMRKAACVVCVSHTTLRNVHEMFGVPLDRLVVAYNGVSDTFVPTERTHAHQMVAERLGIDFEYLLFLGKLEPRKNVLRIIEAYARYRAATQSSAKLLLTGHRTVTTPAVETLIDRLGLDGCVVQPGYVSASDLPLLYSAARMFLFPSLWEGFGIPMIEAMACGTPVIASNVSCLPEIAGDAAVIVDPLSVDAIAEGMIRIDTSEVLRAELVERGLARARQFTWLNSARTTLAVYQRLAVG